VVALDPEVLVFAADDLSALYRVSAVVRDASGEQGFMDAKALGMASAGEHVVLRGAASRAMLDVLHLAGFTCV
jgi:hypothetical protein